MRQIEHFSSEAARIVKCGFSDSAERICSLFEKNCSKELGAETTIYWRNTVLPRESDIGAAIGWLQNALFLYAAELSADAEFSDADWTFFSETVRECADEMPLDELTAILNLFLSRGII